MKTTPFFTLILFFLFFGCSSDNTSTEQQPINDEIYFPPINSNTWATKTINDLDWNETQLEPLIRLFRRQKVLSFCITEKL